MSESKPYWQHSLCAECTYLKTIKNSRGSEFWLCLKAKEVANWPKYHPQPVSRCAFFHKTDTSEEN
ncbi:MAG: hypothetical protein AAGC85_10675 [Bacteroidota bacterium]